MWIDISLIEWTFPLSNRMHLCMRKILVYQLFFFWLLLLQNYNAKIADFGLAKLGPSGGESHVTTRIMGTYGYAAPEYVATGLLYELSIIHIYMYIYLS